MEKLMLLILLTSCGRVNVSGGITNRVEGETRHEIVLTIDQKLCEGQQDVTVCLEKLNTLLQDFLKNLQQTKDIQP
jgi:hypothetical protein